MPPVSPRPFDIVHIVQSTFPADPRVRREALASQELGVRVAVVSLGSPGDAAESDWQGLTVFRIPGDRRRGRAWQYLSEYASFVRAAYRLVKRDPRLNGAAVVHVHTLPDFLVAAARPAKRQGARVILDLHEIFPEFVASKFGSAKGRAVGPIARWLERWSRREADAVITVTRSIEGLLRSRPARADERILVLHNAPDPRDFGQPLPPTGETKSGELRLVYHGTLTELYGLDLAVEGVRLARAQGLAVSFDIFGGGPQLEALQRQIAAGGLAGHVRLRGTVAADELRRLLPTYHGGLVPTRADVMTRYSLSNKLLEYVHLGVPVIAPALLGYREYFPDNSLTFFAPNDAGALARAIEELNALGAEERRRRSSQAQEALAAIGWEAEKPALQALYRKLLHNGSSREPAA